MVECRDLISAWVVVGGQLNLGDLSNVSSSGSVKMISCFSANICATIRGSAVVVPLWMSVGVFGGFSWSLASAVGFPFAFKLPLLFDEFYYMMRKFQMIIRVVGDLFYLSCF